MEKLMMNGHNYMTNKWINVKQISYKIMLLLYTYLILFIYSTVYPSHRYSEGEPKRPEYIPKRLRNKGVKNCTTLMITNITNTCMKYLQKTYDIMMDHMTLTHRRRIARKMANQRMKNQRTKLARVMLMPALAMSIRNNYEIPREQKIIKMDTDSDPIGIDNRCSACISHKIEDFIGNPIESKRVIKGFGGAQVRNIMVGTIRWNWLDDNGMNHTFDIPNSYYVPQGSVRLLSPQHWAQATMKHKKKSTRPSSRTYHDRIVLEWNNGENMLTVPLGKSNNVATFEMAPGYKKFE